MANIYFHQDRFRVWWTQASLSLNLEIVKLIVDNCTELSELALSNISQGAVEYLCQNLTPKICKLHLDCRAKIDFRLPNNSIKILSSRFNKLTALSICSIWISSVAVRHIKNLSNLEKLALPQLDEELTAWIDDLAEMSKLKLLCIDSLFGTKMCQQRLGHLENLTVLVNFGYRKKLMNIAMPDKNRW